ncbi:MAG: pseudouridine synthase [Lachnospiraceae bacterium]
MAEKEVRLDRFVSETADVTRKEAKLFIGKGRVTVNAAVEKNADRKVTESDEVTLDGRSLKAAGMVYLMLHKPAGVISATEDGRERTVLDLIREDEALLQELGRTELFPVGRLDKDTEGLLLLTNDGELAHRLLSPKKHVEKVYYARLDGEVPEDAVSRFAEGIQVGEDYRALPAKLTVLSAANGFSEVLVALTEGKFHQVKRMCHEIGCEVTYLKRLSMGELHLDESLAPGTFRRLTGEEILKLKQ